MGNEAFLQLSEYSNKYGVSLSTLRRRIKTGEIEHKFDQGKYWLPDQPIAKYMRNRPQNYTAINNIGSASRSEDIVSNSNIAKTYLEIGGALKDLQDFTASAKNMMSEIKSAFVKALQEKEEQIMELKNEVADLRTLNRILDEENERLKSSSFPGWIEDSSSDMSGQA